MKRGDVEQANPLTTLVPELAPPLRSGFGRAVVAG